MEMCIRDRVMIERLESDDGESLEGWIDTLKFGADGLIPAVIQESVTGQVLMVGYMNRQSIEMTPVSYTHLFR